MCPYPWYYRKNNIWLPCGRCGACLKRNISDWMCRLKTELRFSECAYWVTLTYENDPVQLYKRDLQGLFKRMRKVGFKFSYFAVGDYGDTFGRPHYHVIFFVKGKFVSDYLHSLWISGDQTRRRGFVHVASLTMGRIAYAVRYGMLAKLDWDKRDKRVKPFFLMSKRPALGASYLNEAKRVWHRRNDVWYYADGKYKKPLPRYLRNKIFPGILERELNAKRALALADAARDRLIEELSRQGHLNPYSKWIERHQLSADRYLEELRKQKQLKNKLL